MKLFLQLFCKSFIFSLFCSSNLIQGAICEHRDAPMQGKPDTSSIFQVNSSQSCSINDKLIS